MQGSELNCHGHPRKFFKVGNVDILLIFFQVADDAMLSEVDKTLKVRARFSSFLKLFQVELYSSLPKGCTFCHPLQHLLNRVLLQYRYCCELQITESE